MVENWQDLAALVASGKTRREACEILGIPESTAYNTTTSKPEFKQRVAELRTEKAEQATGSLVDACEESVAVLRGIAASAERDSDRVAAARALIQLSIRFSETTELRRRIDDLERIAAKADTEARERGA